MTFLDILWFILIAVLWTGYLILEGFSLGAGLLLRVIGKNNAERSQIIRTYGPVWDGNEVWLLTAGGATFAAFPEWYATMFSGMYLALLLILVVLIIRICAIEWRSKIASERWRNVCDWGQCVSAWFVPILFGVAFGNLVQGMKIQITDPKDITKVIPVSQLGEHPLAHHVYSLTGGFFSLLTPYTLLGGLVLMLIFLSQGSLYLTIKTTGNVYSRAKALSKRLTIVGTAVTAVFAIVGQFAYSAQPLYGWIPLVIAALLLIAATAAANVGHEYQAFFLHSVAIAGAVAFIFTSMAPGVLKSSIDPKYTLLIADAASSQATLVIMTIVAAILVPLVLGYTIWAYTRVAGRIGIDDIDGNPGLPWLNVRENANFLAG